MPPNPRVYPGKLSLRKVRFRLPAQDEWEFLVLVELNNKSELSSGVFPRVKSSIIVFCSLVCDFVCAGKLA